MLSDHARRFIEVEIRNEGDGGVSPATIGSAIDSARQAPAGVLANWIGLATPSAHQLLRETPPKSLGTLVGALRKELVRLQDRFGSEFRLQELSDLANQQPLRFTCPNCGRHELEEVQTGVVIVSRVVGLLPGGRRFIYGSRDDLTNEAVPYYRCAACRHGIADDPQEMHKLLDAAVQEARRGEP